MIRLPRPSLFRALFGTFVVVIAIAFALSAWFALSVTRGRLVSLIEENLRYRTAVIAADLDRNLGRYGEEIEVWSRLSLMDDVIIGDSEFSITSFLINLQRERPETYLRLTVLNRTGDAVASTDASVIGSRDQLRPLELHAISQTRFLIGDFPSVHEEGVAELIVAHPIVSQLDPEPIGWILAHLDWYGITRVITESSIDEQAQDDRRFMLLLDRDGVVLAGHPELLADLPRLPAPANNDASIDVIELAVPAGDSYLLFSANTLGKHSALSDELRVLGFWRKADAYKVVRLLAMAIVGSALIGLVLCASASFVIARKLSSRIHLLADGTSRLAEGDYGARVEEGSADELGSLARSFNHMAGELNLAKRSLDRTLARWRSLVSHVPDIIMTLDSEAMILFVSRPALGRTIDQIVGLSLYDLLPARYHPRMLGRLRKVFTTGEPARIDFEIRDANDDRNWYASRLGPIRQGKRIETLIMIITDISVRRSLEQQTLQAAESERKRIGQDLHDDLGQILTGTALMITGLEGRLAAKGVAEAENLRQLTDLINQAIQRTRALAKGLFPITLEREGLPGALKELAIYAESVFGVSCEVELQGRVISLDLGSATHLFRIAQEAVSNSVRHGNAKNLMIRLRAGVHKHSLVIRDDGSGYIKEESGSSGTGLRLMRYRAGMLGATINVRGRPGRGTVLLCVFQTDEEST